MDGLTRWISLAAVLAGCAGASSSKGGVASGEVPVLRGRDERHTAYGEPCGAEYARLDEGSAVDARPF
jgi:hypothetical protein